MKLSLLIEPQNIVTPVASETPRGIIEELLAHAGAGDKDICDSYCKDVLAREEHGGTLLGGGVYFPHARTATDGEMKIAFGVSSKGIDLDTPDGEPVRYVLLIVAPVEKNTALLKARAAFIKFLLNKGNSKKIIEADSPQEVHKIIKENDVYIGDMLTVNDVVNSEIVSVEPDMTLRQLLNKMFVEELETLPVLEDGRIIGVVTGQEILRLAIPKFADRISSLKFIESRTPFEAILVQRDETTVADIMEKDFLKAHTDVSLLQIAHLMATTGRKYVYIVDEKDNETFIGIVSRRELLIKVLVA